MGNLSHRYFNNKMSNFYAQILGQKVLIIEGNDSIEFSHINFENTTLLGVLAMLVAIQAIEKHPSN